MDFYEPIYARRLQARPEPSTASSTTPPAEEGPARLPALPGGRRALHDRPLQHIVGPKASVRPASRHDGGEAPAHGAPHAHLLACHTAAEVAFAVYLLFFDCFRHLFSKTLYLSLRNIHIIFHPLLNLSYFHCSFKCCFNTFQSNLIHCLRPPTSDRLYKASAPTRERLSRKQGHPREALALDLPLLPHHLRRGPRRGPLLQVGLRRRAVHLHKALPPRLLHPRG